MSFWSQVKQLVGIEKPKHHAKRDNLDREQNIEQFPMVERANFSTHDQATGVDVVHPDPAAVTQVKDTLTTLIAIDQTGAAPKKTAKKAKKDTTAKAKKATAVNNGKVKTAKTTVSKKKA